MKIIVSKKTLAVALQHCSSAATKNSTMPILRCVLLTPGDGGFTVRAANEGIKMSVTCKVAAKVTAPEAICVPAHDFLDRVKALPDGDIELATKGGKLSLKSGKRQLSLSVLAADDYPSLPAPSGTPVTLPVAMLGDSIRSVLFAVSDDPANGGMYGIKLRLSGNVLCSAATDARRVSEFRCTAPDGEIDALIPKTSAVLLKTVLESASGEAVVSGDGPTIYVSIGDVTFAAVTLADSRFPPIENVFREAMNPCEVMSEPALDALRALAVVSGRAGAMQLAASADTMRASVTSEENGESSDEFMMTGGHSFESVKAQASYLIDAIAAAASETVTIDCGSRTDAILITGGRVRGVVMPVII